MIQKIADTKIYNILSRLYIHGHRIVMTTIKLRVYRIGGHVRICEMRINPVPMSEFMIPQTAYQNNSIDMTTKCKLVGPKSPRG